MARAREFDPEQALDRATALFWRQGYRATSVDDLVRETGVSKYGLYGVFGSKRELFRRALFRFWDQVGQDVQADLRKPDGSLPEIRRYFNRLAGMADEKGIRRGCMACNTATEVGPFDEEIGVEVRRLFSHLQRTFRLALERAKQRGEVSPNLDVSRWANHLVSMVQSSAVKLRAGYPAAAIRQDIDLSLELLTRE
ncbi:MAG TPA: TetR family transcriptional regulator [Terriglobia bacterium]|nr:TetR family transcriptional regulator [Terriglobia bacterium]